jgi:hypothetical protein
MSALEQADQATRSRSYSHWIVPAILLTIYVAQCAWFIRTQSLTFDEPLHIVAGLEAWRDGKFEHWNDHPPLARLLMTLPLRGEQFQVMVTQDEQYRIDTSKLLPSPEAIAWRGRAVNVALGVILGCLLWVAARRLWSASSANFVLALFAFSPSLIAHFSLITTDGIGALTIFAASLQLIRWRRNPSWAQTILLGIVLGLLLLAKFYTPPFFVLTIVLMLVLKPKGWRAAPYQWNWGSAFVAAAVAFFVLWAGYFFHVSHLTAANGTLVATYPNRPPLVKSMSTPVSLNLWIPAGEYIDGLRQVKFHNRLGHASYFFGRVSHRGESKSYYPVLILLKWPTIVLLLLLVTGGAAAIRRLRPSPDWAVLAAYPVLSFGMAMLSRIQIGERHILPAYVFALLFAGGAWELAQTSGRRVQALVLIGLALNAADVSRYSPDYLSYFNVFVRPQNSWRLVTDSNLDWGQGLVALRKYEAAHPNETIHLAYFGSIRPELYGIRTLPLTPGEQVHGTVVVSATQLSGQNLDDPQTYRWVLSYPLRDTLNHSMLVFDVP